MKLTRFTEYHASDLSLRPSSTGEAKRSGCYSVRRGVSYPLNPEKLRTLTMIRFDLDDEAEEMRVH